MSVEGCAIELGQDVDLADPRVDAVAHWDINQAVDATDRDGWFGSGLGQGVEP